MSIQIKLKNSVVQDSTPSTSDLPAVGELALNANINSIGGFMRASNNTIVKIFGPGSVTTPTATTTVSGISELATNTETTTGTATNRVVTPAGLNAVTTAERSTSNTNYVAKAGSTLTGVLTMPNGSNSAPSINFGDSDSGIFGGTNTVSLAAGGTTGLTLNASGQVNVPTRLGVGIASPLSLLHTKATNADNVFTLETATSGSPKITFNAAGAGGHTIGFDRGSAALTFTVAGGSERARIDNSGRLLIGTSTARSPQGISANFQIEGTNVNNSSMSLTRNSADNASAALIFNKSRGATVGSDVVVQDDDVLGIVYFTANDGTDSDNSAATITAEVDGTPGSNDTPGRLKFSTTADGAASPTTRLTIDSAGLSTFTGDLTISSATPIINLTDTNNDSDYQIKNGNGDFNIKDVTNNANRLTIASDGTVDIAGNLDANGGLDVTGSVNATTDITLASTTSGQSFIVTKNGTQAAKLGHIGTGNEGILVLKDGGTDIVKINGAAAGVSYFNGGNVGIGTTSPASLLNLAGASGACTLQLSRSNASANGNTYGNLKFTSDTSVDVARIRATRQSAANDALLAFDTASSGTLSERMRIDASGNVGIGTTSPQALFEISGANNAVVGISLGQAVATLTSSRYIGITQNGDVNNLAANSGFQGIEFGGPGSAAEGYLAFHTHDNGVASGERMRIDKSGNVGIGTTSPTGVLEIDAASTTAMIMLDVGGTNFARLGHNSSGGSPLLDVRSEGHFRILTNGNNERFRISSGGNVGIGTTSPDQALHVIGTSGDTVPVRVESTGITARIGFQASGTANSYNVACGAAAEDFTFYTGNTERMRLDSSGRVGIGHDTPSSFSSGAHTLVLNTNSGNCGLTISTSAADQIGSIFFAEGSSSTGDGRIRYEHVNNAMAFTTADSERMRIDSSGLVGIGTDAPTCRLQVDAGSSGAGTVTAIELNHKGNDLNDAIKLNFARAGGDIGSISLEKVNNNNTTDFIFNTRTSNTVSESMRITGAGNLGIGTTAPVEKLGVDGGIRLVTANGETNRITSLPSGSYTLGTSGGAAIGFTRTADGGGGSDQIIFETHHHGSSHGERMRIDKDGRLLIGTTTQFGDGHDRLMLESGTNGGRIAFGTSAGFSECIIAQMSAYWADNKKVAAISFFGGSDTTNKDDGTIRFHTSSADNLTERMRVHSGGQVTIGSNDLDPWNNNSSTATATGFNLVNVRGGLFAAAAHNGDVLALNRMGNDGAIIIFYGQGSPEGSIDVNGSTVSLNGAHLSRWTKIPSINDTDKSKRPTIYRGSVLTNLDAMCEWKRVEYTNSDNVTKTKPYSGSEDVGSTVEYTDDKGDKYSAKVILENNEQLNKMELSSVEGDPNVAGVFQGWDDDDDTIVNDLYCAMTGDFIIRIAKGVTVQRGDLLMSAGDGTAKPQDDDIVRSKTVAKVTSTVVSTTYDDESYCVPCVLMAC